MRRALQLQSNISVAVRDMAVFTQQSEALANNKKNLGYKSNIWVYQNAEYWYRTKSELKAGEKATQVSAPYRFELYNASQLTTPTVFGKEPEHHSSGRSNKSYTGLVVKKLEKSAAKHGFRSKWWLTAATAKEKGLTPRWGQKPIVTLSYRLTDVFNAEQFQNPSAIEEAVFSGATAKPFGGASAEKLRAHAASFPDAVYFTERHLEVMKLEVAPEHKDNGCRVQTEGVGDFRLYNIDEVVEGGALINKLNRFPTDKHTYLLSGIPIGGSFEPLVSATTFTSKYWISQRDLTFKGGRLLPNAKGVAQKSTGEYVAYNIHQLTDPAKAFQKIGSYVPKQ